MNQINIKIKISFALAVLALVLTNFSIAFAADAPKVSISPSILKIVAKQGDKVNQSISFRNDTGSDQKIDISVSAFVPSDGESGTPIFTDKDSKVITSDSTSWIAVKKLDSNTIANGTEKEIKFTISVPDNAPKQKYYNAIFVTSSGITKTGTQSGSTINTRMAALVVLEVEKTALEKTREDLGKIQFTQSYFQALYSILKDNIVISIILAILMLLIIITLIIRRIKRNQRKDIIFEERKPVQLIEERVTSKPKIKRKR